MKAILAGLKEFKKRSPLTYEEAQLKTIKYH
jgi:hypothetical protein